MLVVGLDIGGKSVKAAIIDEEGKLYLKETFHPSYEDEANDCVRKLAKELNEWIKSTSLEVKAIGIGCPGVIDSNSGRCLYANNLHWYGADVCEIISKETNLPSYAMNDGEAALLGEIHFGEANYKSVVLLTLGTGVGGGIYLDNKIYLSFDGQGTEIGHMVIRKGGRPCACGRLGCFEQYASATAIEREARNRLQDHPESKLNKEGTSASKIFKAYENGDEFAKELVNEYVEGLGEGILNIINIFRPQAILLSGGVSEARETLLNPLNKYLEDWHYGYAGNFCEKTIVKIASLGSKAGIYGAAAIALEKLK